MIFYRDPIQLMTHLAEKLGTDAVTGIGRDDRLEPGTRQSAWPLRGVHAAQDDRSRCTPAPQMNSERQSHTRGDVRDGDGCHRPLPARQGQARGACVACSPSSPSTPLTAGPYTPGSATCLAFALAVPSEGTAMMTKLEGGIGALGPAPARAVRLPRRRDAGSRQGRKDPHVENDRVTGVRLKRRLRDQRRRSSCPTCRPT